VVPLPTATVQVGEELFHGCTVKPVPLELPQVPAVLEPSTDWTTPATPKWVPLPEWARTVGKPRPIEAIRAPIEAIRAPIAAAPEIRRELNMTRSYPSIFATAPSFSGSSPNPSPPPRRLARRQYWRTHHAASVATGPKTSQASLDFDPTSAESPGAAIQSSYLNCYTQHRRSTFAYLDSHPSPNTGTMPR
jgi:hypothetical protein